MKYIFIMLILVSSRMSAQEAFSPLKVGDKLPAEFWTKEHDVFINNQIVKQTFEPQKGKLLILKFWATWCSTCIGKFPLVDSLNRLEGIHVAMVAGSQTKDTAQSIATLFQKHRLAKKFELQSIVDDGTLLSLFPYKYVPHYIWIDYTGRILAITNYYFFTAEKVKEILASQLKQSQRGRKVR